MISFHRCSNRVYKTGLIIRNSHRGNRIPKFCPGKKMQNSSVVYGLLFCGLVTTSARMALSRLFGSFLLFNFYFLLHRRIVFFSLFNYLYYLDICVLSIRLDCIIID